MTSRRFLPLVALLSVSALSRLALACPSCAANGAARGAFWWILGGMLLLPFGVAALVAGIIRRGELGEANDELEQPAN